MEPVPHFAQRFQPQQNRRQWIMQRPDALLVLFVLFMLFGVCISEHSERTLSRNFVQQRAHARHVSQQSGVPKGLEVIPPRLTLPELSLASGKRVRKGVPGIRSAPLDDEERDSPSSFDEYYHDDEVADKRTSLRSPPSADQDDSLDYYGSYFEDKEDEGALARIEKQIIAPVHMIGKYQSTLGVGSVLVSADGRDQVSFPKGSLVLITEMTNDFYRGFIINSELPESERLQAQHALRLSSATSGSSLLDVTKIAFYGYGGPVKTRQERWNVLHEDALIEDSHQIGSNLALNGDLEVVLNKKDLKLAVFYGAAVWIPGQLERELSEGLWTIQPDKVTTFNDLLQLCAAR